ncbi:MAG: hypothetical protein WA960_21960 [Tunicatimonas sp.]
MSFTVVSEQLTAAFQVVSEVSLIDGRTARRGHGDRVFIQERINSG